MAKRSARRAAPQPAEAVATPWASAGAHEAVALVLPRLPVMDRVRCAAVCRVWRDAAAETAVWLELDFRGSDAPIDTEALAALCARAGPSLRALHLDDETALLTLSAASVLYALQAADACAGLQELTLPCPDNLSWYHTPVMPNQLTLLPAQAVALKAACPALKVAACGVVCGSQDDAELAAAALPGPLTLCFTSGWGDAPQSVTPAHWVAPSVEGMICIGYESPDTTDADVMYLANALRAAPAWSLRGLDIWSSLVGDAGVGALSEALRCQNCALCSLLVNTPLLTDDCGAELVHALATNTSLLHLRMCPTETQLGRATGLAFASMLNQNSTLRSLELHVSLDDAVMMTLSNAISEQGTLRSLCLCNMHVLLGAAGASALATVLRPSARSRLEHLRIVVRPKARRAVIAAICDAAAEPGGAPALVHLRIDAADFDDGASPDLSTGARWLDRVCAMLRSNTTLEELLLRDLFATDEDLTALADALRSNGTLCLLCTAFMEDVTRKNSGMEALAAALTPPSRAAASLKYLDLSGMRVGVAGSRALCTMLRENTMLRHLYAPRAPEKSIFDDDDDAFAAVVPLCAALRVNRTLRALTFGSAGSLADVAALGRALAHNVGLLSLECNGLTMDSGGSAAMSTGLRSNTHLRHLSIGVKTLGAHRCRFWRAR